MGRFESGINGVSEFLYEKKVSKAADFAKLDDIEARHVMDQIIMYCGLDGIRLHEI